MLTLYSIWNWKCIASWRIATSKKNDSLYLWSGSRCWGHWQLGQQCRRWILYQCRRRYRLFIYYLLSKVGTHSSAMNYGISHKIEWVLEIISFFQILFILAAAIYMQSGHGTAPYDAVSFWLGPTVDLVGRLIKLRSVTERSAT